MREAEVVERFEVVSQGGVDDAYQEVGVHVVYRVPVHGFRVLSLLIRIVEIGRLCTGLATSIQAPTLNKTVGLEGKEINACDGVGSFRGASRN